MILWSQDPTSMVLLFAIGKQHEILVLSPRATLLDKCISSMEYILNLASCDDENIHRLSFDKAKRQKKYYNNHKKKIVI